MLEAMLQCTKKCANHMHDLLLHMARRITADISVIDQVHEVIITSIICIRKKWVGCAQKRAQVR